MEPLREIEISKANIQVADLILSRNNLKPEDWQRLRLDIARTIDLAEASGPGEVDQLRTAIRSHRDQRGDDRCWQDDETLYAVLPEGFTAPARDSSVELANCQRYIACRHNPGTEYVSPQREIERLRKIVGCVIRNLRNMTQYRELGDHHPLDGPLQAKVSFVCGVGSTSAQALCVEFECDPDYETPEPEVEQE